MKIGIDYSPVTTNPAGIGQLTLEITQALLKHHPEHEYVIYTQSLIQGKQLKGGVFIPVPKQGPAKGIRWMRRVAKHARDNNLDIIFSPTAMVFPYLFNKVVQTVNDLSPIMYPQGFTWKQRLVYRLGLWVTAKYAHSIFFISKSVMDEFTARYKTKAKLGYSLLGLNEFVKLRITNHELRNIRSELELPEKYFASVSTLEPRKNYENMVRAFAEFSKEHQDYQYLIAGKKGWMYEQLFKLVKELGVEKQVRFLGYVNDLEKWVLLKHAVGFLYVSHYEGFGLPNIEAAALGTPVLTSDIPVMHEVMGESALYAEPKNVKQIKEQMSKLTSERNQSELALSKFSWRNTSDELVRICINL